MPQTNPQRNANRSASTRSAQRNTNRTASPRPAQRTTNRTAAERPVQRATNRSASPRPAQRTTDRSTSPRTSQHTTNRSASTRPAQGSINRTRIVRPVLRRPTWGIGSLSLLLLLLSALWSASFSGKCLGDTLLTKWHLPAWSPHAIGVHYTPFYALVLIIPAYFLANLYPRHRGTTMARLLSVLWMGALIIFAVFFVITEISHA